MSLWVQDVEMAGHLAWITSPLVVIDLADPSEPKELGGLFVGGADIERQGGLVYLAGGTGGLRIYDFGPEYVPEPAAIAASAAALAMLLLLARRRANTR